MAYAPQFNAYQFRLFHTVDNLTHVYKYYAQPANFAAAPGLSFGTYAVVARDESEDDCATAIEGFLSFFDGMFTADSTFTAVELWKYNAGSLDAIFLSAYDPVTQPSVVEAFFPASQRVFTARTAGGNIAKLTAIEGRGNIQSLSQWSADPAGSSVEQLGAFFTSATASFIRDRFGTLPIATLRVGGGENESVWRKRYRP